MAIVPTEGRACTAEASDGPIRTLYMSTIPDGIIKPTSHVKIVQVLMLV